MEMSALQWMASLSCTMDSSESPLSATPPDLSATGTAATPTYNFQQKWESIKCKVCDADQHLNHERRGWRPGVQYTDSGDVSENSPCN